MHSTLENAPLPPTHWDLESWQGKGKRVQCDSGESPHRMTHHNLSGCVAKEGGFQEGTQRSFSHQQVLGSRRVSTRTTRLSQTLVLHKSRIRKPNPVANAPGENIPISTAHLLNFTSNSRASSLFHSFLYSAHVCWALTMCQTLCWGNNRIRGRLSMPFWDNISSSQTWSPSQLFHNENRIQATFTSCQSNLRKWGSRQFSCLRKWTVEEETVDSIELHIYILVCSQPFQGLDFAG